VRSGLSSRQGAGKTRRETTEGGSTDRRAGGPARSGTRMGRAEVHGSPVDHESHVALAGLGRDYGVTRYLSRPCLPRDSAFRSIEGLDTDVAKSHVLAPTCWQTPVRRQTAEVRKCPYRTFSVARAPARTPCMTSRFPS